MEKQQQEKIQRLMAKVAAQMKDRKHDPAVMTMIPELVSVVMSQVTDEQSTVDPISAVFALGMAANAVATVMSDQYMEADGEGVPLDESKMMAMTILRYAMMQTVIAKDITGTDQTPFMKNHGPAH